MSTQGTILLVIALVVTYGGGFVVTYVIVRSSGPYDGDPFATPVPTMWPLVLVGLVVASPWMALGALARRAYEWWDR